MSVSAARSTFSARRETAQTWSLPSTTTNASVGAGTRLSGALMMSPSWQLVQTRVVWSAAFGRSAQ